MVIPAGAVKAVQVSTKLFGQEGHFTLGADSVSRLYLPSHCSGIIGTTQLAPPAVAIQAVEDWSKSFSK
jgi:hypothetical protein